MSEHREANTIGETTELLDDVTEARSDEPC